MLGSTWEGGRCVEFSLSAVAGGEERRTIYLCFRKEKTLEMGINS